MFFCDLQLNSKPHEAIRVSALTVLKCTVGGCTLWCKASNFCVDITYYSQLLALMVPQLHMKSFADVLILYKLLVNDSATDIHHSIQVAFFSR